jgi:predicted TIM-barrel fold metal-dependent hydrolase
MHAYYQDCAIDDPRLSDLYAMLAELGMLLVIHAGYDIAYPRIRLADPARILDVCRQFPDLKLIATHLGGWDEWEDVETLLVGKPVFMELSFALNELAPARLRRILLAHPADFLLFGTDAPWTDQADSLDLLRRLDLPEALVERITVTNARRLLGT